MKVFAILDNYGFPTGFYLEGQRNIPTAAIEITRAQHRECLTNQGKRRWNGKTFVPDDITNYENTEDLIRERWESLRRRRDNLLSRSDWTQLDDSPLSLTTKRQWKEWRASLRDIPQTHSDDIEAAERLLAKIKNEINTR